MRAAQRADEEVALPARVAVAGQKRQSRRRNRRNPVSQRRCDVGAFGAIADLRADAVVAAVGDDGPAVVGAGRGHVEFVAALRPVLHRPQLAGRRMQRCALDVAVAVAPDLRLGILALHERVVGRRLAVGLDAHDFADVVVERLRVVLAREAVAEADEELAVTRPDQARAEMVVAAADLGCLAEDDLHVGERVAVERGARDGGARAAVSCLAVAPIDQPVARELRVQHHVEQAALARGHHRRQAGQRRIQRTVALDDAHAPRPLGDEHAAVGQKGQAPRMLEALGDDDGLERLCCGARADERGGQKR